MRKNMSYTAEQIEATAQLDRARISLGEALGQTQDISNSGLDVEKISSSLAKSVRNIFSVQSAGLASPKSSANIQQAMDALRQTLMLLQDVQSDDESLQRVMRTVAHILALLYPVSKVLELVVDDSEGKASQEPLPLTQSRQKPSDADRDRRSSTRRIFEVDIGIHSDTNFFTGFSQDISSGGLFIATYDIMALGSDINVNFTLPSGPVLSLNGKIRWIREYNETTPDTAPGMGVQFDDLTERDQRAINRFIATNPPIFYDDE